MINFLKNFFNQSILRVLVFYQLDLFGYRILPFVLLKSYNKNNRETFLTIHEKKENNDLTERQICLKIHEHEGLKNLIFIEKICFQHNWKSKSNIMSTNSEQVNKVG